MTETQIKELFRSLISERNWYKNTKLSRQEAYNFKKSFNDGKMLYSSILIILIELGKIKVVENKTS